MDNKLDSKVKDSVEKPNPKCWLVNTCEDDIKDCSEKCIWYFCMKNLLDSSELPKDKQRVISLYPDDIDYDAYVTLGRLRKNIYDFVKDGKNLYICSGQVGNGKTSWAIKLLQSYFAQIAGHCGFDVKGKFIHVPTFLLDMKNFKDRPIDQDTLDMLRTVDIVVWDDIGDYVSGYDSTILLSIVDTRIFNGKCNIFTGNATDYNQMCKAYGERLASRIFNNSYVVELKGRDKRIQQGKDLGKYIEGLENATSTDTK